MMQFSSKMMEAGAVSTPDILNRLAKAPSQEGHPHLAARLGAAFARGGLSEPERLVAIEIFKCLIRSTEVEVRRTLAEHIKNSPLLPHGIARQLADDIESVAIPILQCSQALTDEDLISIIESGSTAKQRAIAKRETLSQTVTGALVDTGKKDVVGVLLANDGAEISETSYQHLLDDHSDDPEIQERLADRSALPFEVMQRLVCFVSDDLQARLMKQHAFPEVMAEELTLHGRERALIQALPAAASLQEIEAAVMRLYLKGALTPSLLLRAICTARLELCLAGIATLARIPCANALKAMAEAGPAAFRSLYKKSDLPAHLQQVFLVALEVVLEAKRTSNSGWQEADEKRLIQRLVQVHHRLSPDGLESVLSQLGRLNPNG